MKSGRKTLRQIEQGIEDLRRQESKLQSDLERDTRRRVGLLEERTAAYRELAEVRTRAAVADGVIDRADRLEGQVASILSARQKTIDALKARDVEAHGRRDHLNTVAEALRDEIDALEQQLDRIGQQAISELEAEQSYQSLFTSVTVKAETLARAEDKTKRAENDRKEKGKAFENDPLFMYLWTRKYGSKDYSVHAFVRMGDDWVARLIGYHDARANYAMLDEIPERLQAHCETLRDELAGAQDALDTLVADRIALLAGTDLTGSLHDARTRQNDTNSALEAIDAEITDLSLQLNRYAEGLDEAYRKAVALSADFLERETYRELLALARSTPDTTDDALAERIRHLSRDADKLEKTVEDGRKALDRLANRRHELLEVAGNFRRNRYDDDSSFFEPDDLVEDMLKLLLQGGLSAAEYWLRSQGQHRWRMGSADPFRRSGRWPDFGSGRGGSRGRRSRRRGGGRFSTGGGF
ncbi:MAG: hypothetical protein AAFO75_09035 [Pseudomonadota bacterium]